MQTLETIDWGEVVKGAVLLEAVHSSPRFVPTPQRRLYSYGLTQRQWEAINRRVFKGLNYEEIGREMDVTKSTAWELFLRGMQQLYVIAPGTEGR